MDTVNHLGDYIDTTNNDIDCRIKLTAVLHTAIICENSIPHVLTITAKRRMS